MKALFITSTDTGVGKTFVTACLLRLLRARGVDAVPMKPFECGPETPADSQRLWQAAGKSGAAPEWVTPFRFAAPQAPAQAAVKENRAVDIKQVTAAFAKATGEHATVLVEGCGGLLVPLLPDRPEYTIEDLIRELDVPVLIVGRAGLGTLNHTLLTAKRCATSGLRTAGIVLNHCTAPKTDDSSVPENAATLRALCGVPVWGPLEYVAGGATDAALERALKMPGVVNPLNDVIDRLWANATALC